jgi:aminoglycoside phosphotransferase (APT) family kinase protein
MLADDEPPTFRDVLNLLTSSGVVSGATWVEGVAIERMRHRNICYLVEVADGDSFVVKYLHPRSGRLGVAKEAAVLGDLAAAGSPSLRRVLPTLVWHSEARDVLVYAATAGELPMTHQVLRGRPPQRLARSLAVALAHLHRAPTPPYTAQRPHGLTVHHPLLSSLESTSGANLELLVRIQGNDRLVADLDHAAEAWRTDTFVHGDLKFDNILGRRDSGGRSQSVRIVDWEDAGAGDARWDVGAVLAAYVAAWLTSIPNIRAEGPSALAPLARVKREALLPSVRAFWECYSSRRLLDRDEPGEFLREAVRFAGVRLVQAASEGTVATPLTAVHLFLLQVGANMLARPTDAMTRLLGLGIGSRATTP